MCKLGNFSYNTSYLFSRSRHFLRISNSGRQSEGITLGEGYGSRYGCREGTEKMLRHKKKGEMILFTYVFQ